jgi:hypothetical protein
MPSQAGELRRWCGPEPKATTRLEALRARALGLDGRDPSGVRKRKKSDFAGGAGGRSEAGRYGVSPFEGVAEGCPREDGEPG